MSASEHQPHGHCRTCGYPAHCYPFGWDHVGAGVFSCPRLDAIASCCAAHSVAS